MKKILLVLLSFTLILTLLTACGNTSDTPDNDTENTTDKTSEKNESKEDLSRVNWPDEEKYKFFQVYDAPEGENLRTIVMDHMLKMANIEWTPAENFSIQWKDKDKATFNPTMNLRYQKGKTYKGLPYGLTHASLELFEQHIDQNNRYKSSEYYYETIVGNHCSSSMMMAYQQIIDMPLGMTMLYPCDETEGIFKFPTDLKIPNKKDWTSKELHALNGQQAIYEAYAALDKGDVLFNRPSGAGHTRMVSRVELEKNKSGAVNYSRSVIYVVEQTDVWSSNKQESTWHIDKPYTFKELFDKNFMPVTLNVFHEEDVVLQDAYIAYDGENTTKTITTALSGTVSSNFPLNYLKLQIENDKGEIVKEIFLNRLNKAYKFNLRKYTSDLDAASLEKGTYKFIVKTGISRGGAIVETVEFTVE